MTVIPLPLPSSKNATSSLPKLANNFQAELRNHYRAHVDGTNINKTTLLTTDYLNHFNEVVMLMEMLPSAPGEFMMYLSAWEPMTYREHFSTSGFRDKDLAIAAYDCAPEDIRVAFDATVGQLNNVTLAAIEGILVHAENGRQEEMSRAVTEAIEEIQPLIERAYAIINDGSGAILAATEAPREGTCPDSMGQKDIDSLFS